jgi:hypothetical protein
VAELTGNSSHEQVNMWKTQLGTINLNRAVFSLMKMGKFRVWKEQEGKKMKLPHQLTSPFINLSMTFIV